MVFRLPRYHSQSSTMKEAEDQVDHIQKLRERNLQSRYHSHIRIGNKYQAEIPCLKSEFDSKSSPENPHEPVESFSKYSSNDIWTKNEEDSLMIGLYIFGKNFSEVKRFIGSKTIDVQTFYYTKFYKWCVNSKVRKDGDKICKKRLLTEPTHQLLLSRLLHNQPLECYNKLLEVSKNFVEEKMSLEDYAHTLKALVGLNSLIEAVGIGKQNDLTNLTTNSMNYIFPIRSGKDWSKLTTSELIHVLRSDDTKIRSRVNDVFWEAIWPRLLAKGWHSEQPDNKNCSVYHKSPIMFIIPGIQEFSKKLLKDFHYYDSVKDVFDEVSKYPELIIDSASENDSHNKDSVGVMCFDRGNTSGVSSYIEKSQSKKVLPKRTIVDFNLPGGLETVEGEEAVVNEGAVRKSRRSHKLSLKALESIADKVEGVKTMVNEVTVRKSKRSLKLTMKALEAVAEKYEEEETNNKRRRM